MTTWLVRCAVCGASFQRPGGVVPVASPPTSVLAIPQHTMLGTLIPCPGADMTGVAFGKKR